MSVIRSKPLNKFCKSHTITEKLSPSGFKPITEAGYGLDGSGLGANLGTIRRHLMFS